MRAEDSDKILYEGNWIVTISKEFLFNTNLSRDSRFLLVILKSFTNDNNKKAFPSRPYLCSILGCCDKSLSKYLKELEEFNFITKKKEKKNDGTFKANTYLISEKVLQKKMPKVGKTGQKSIGKFSMMVKNPDNIEQYINEDWSKKL